MDAMASWGVHVLFCIFSAIYAAIQRSNSLRRKRHPSQFDPRNLTLLGQSVDGLLSCLQVNRHPIQRENFIIRMVHVRDLF